MKPTAVLLTVILLIAATLFIGGSCTTLKEAGAATHDYNKVSLEEEAAPLPLPDRKQAASPAAAILKVEHSPIGTIESVGESIDCSIAPPPMPEDEKKEEVIDELIMCDLATEAGYPGGATAWQRYLNKNLRFPEAALDEEMSFSVVVQFVVDEEGNVCDVEAIRGSKALGAEAVRVIEQSGKWIPAKKLSNGRCIRSFKRQPFIIHFESEE